MYQNVDFAPSINMIKEIIGAFVKPGLTDPVFPVIGDGSAA